MNESLANMLRYNLWATTTLLEACRSLTDEQLDAPAVPGSSGTLREMALHCGSQDIFVLRASGRGINSGSDDWSAWRGWDALIDVARKSGEELVELARAHDTDSDLDYPHLGKTYRFPSSFFLVHAVAHGDQHRSEIKMSMASLGVSSPDLDAWNWAPAAGIGREVGRQRSD